MQRTVRASEMSAAEAADDGVQLPALRRRRHQPLDRNVLADVHGRRRHVLGRRVIPDRAADRGTRALVLRPDGGGVTRLDDRHPAARFTDDLDGHRDPGYESAVTLAVANASRSAYAPRRSRARRRRLLAAPSAVGGRDGPAAEVLV